MTLDQLIAKGDVRLDDDDASAGVTIKANDTTTASYTLTLPQAVGANGQLLSTNASGELSWITPGGGGDMYIATYDAGGNGIVNNSEALGGNAPSYYTNATNITSGTLPVAQVPNLDSAKITTGTFAPARIATDASNRFVTDAEKTSWNGAASAVSAGSADWDTAFSWGDHAGEGYLKATDLSATAPLDFDDGTGVVSISAATTSSDGYLSSTDWNTFNNKQAAIGAATDLTLDQLVAKGDVRLDDDDASAGVTIKANDTTTASYTLTLPPAVGANGQLLSTSASGELSWITPGGGGDMFVATYDAGGNGIVNNAEALGGNAPSYYTNATNITSGTLPVAQVPNLDSAKITTGTFAPARIATDASNRFITDAERTAWNGAVAWGDHAGAGYIGLGDLSDVGPINYNNGTGAIGIDQAGSGQDGYLSGVDWAIFAGKQNAIGALTDLTLDQIVAKGDVKFDDDDASHGVTIKANDTTTATYTLSLPAAAPATNGQLLSVDTSGVLSWVSPGGGGDMFRSTYDTDTDSIADNAEALGGNAPSYYRDASNINAGTIGDAYIPAAIARDSEVTAAVAGAMFKSTYDTNDDGIVNNAAQLNGQAASYYTNATNITSGTLPVAQVPNLDSAKITTGTFAPARIATDASNRFVTDAQIAAWGAKQDAIGALTDLTLDQIVAKGDVKFDDDDASHGVTIKANDTTTATYTLSLPAAAPASNGQLLSVDTSGVLSWVSPGGGGDMFRSTYDTDTDSIADNAEALGGNAPSYYTNATNITTGTLPVAQVPNLDSAKITTGTFAPARIATDASNRFVTDAEKTSWNGAASAVSAGSSDWDAAFSWGDHAAAGYIGLTDLSDTGPINYNNGTGAIGIDQAGSGQDGYLSGVDWAIFAGKQNAIGAATDLTLDQIVAKGDVKFDDDDASHGVTIKANDTTTASYVLSLPAAAPASNGQLLSVDTSGVLSWVTPGGGGDMFKSTYDTGNNGVVDNAEALGGQPGSYYNDAANLTGTIADARIPAAIARDSEIAAAARGALSGTAPINYTSGTGVIAIDAATTTAGSMSGADKTKLDGLPSVANAMSKATYDTNDDGVVNNAAQLNGQAASYYLDATNISSGTLADARIDAAIARDSELPTAASIATGFAADAVSGDKVHGGTISNFASTGIDDNADALAITINSSENVGIGTASPLYPLHVVQDNAAVARIRIQNPNAGASSATQVDAANDAGSAVQIGVTSSGHTSPSQAYILGNGTSELKIATVGGTQPISFAPSNVERMRITNNGSVGIGTTNPFENLHVKGVAGSPTSIRIERGANTDKADLVFSPNGALSAGNPQYNIGIDGTYSNFQVRRWDGTTTHRDLTVDTTGNVGIGTASPTQKLSIVDTTSGSGTQVIDRSVSTTANGTTYSAGIYSQVFANVNSGVTNSGHVNGGSFIGYNNGAGNLAANYGVLAYSGNNTGSSGNLTGSTAVQAHVYNGGSGTITSASGIYALVQNAGAGSITNGYAVHIADVEATTGFGVYQAGTNDLNYFGGSVGIGTAAPATKLEVNGAVKIGTQTTCNAGATGAMRWSGSDFEGCNGSAWISLTNSANVLRLRYTRTKWAEDASDANKDAQCASEFGSGYAAAMIQDVTANSGHIDTDENNADGKFTVYGDTEPWASITDQYLYRWAGTNGTWPVACILKTAPIRFTRTSVAFNASTATKDAQCSTEFGASYKTGRHFDLSTNSSGGAQDTSVAYFNAFEATQSYYWPSDNMVLQRGGSTYKLLCVR